MVCSFMDHWSDAKMFKTYVEPRTAGELCHCKDSLAPLGLEKPLLAGDQIPGAPLSFL